MPYCVAYPPASGRRCVADGLDKATGRNSSAAHIVNRNSVPSPVTGRSEFDGSVCCCKSFEKKTPAGSLRRGFSLLTALSGYQAGTATFSATSWKAGIWSKFM